jgi:hypothetical protein
VKRIGERSVIEFARRSGPSKNTASDAMTWVSAGGAAIGGDN